MVDLIDEMCEFCGCEDVGDTIHEFVCCFGYYGICGIVGCLCDRNVICFGDCVEVVCVVIVCV